MLAVLLAIAAACIAGSTVGAATAAAAWNCDATALRGSVAGDAVVAPVSANLGRPACRDEQADGSNLLPAPLASSVIFARTSLLGANGPELAQTANAAGGIADLSLGSLGALPIDLPVEQAVESVPPLTVPAAPPELPDGLTLDLRPQLRAAIASLQNLDVLRVHNAVSWASGRYAGTSPQLAGSSAVAGLTVLGQSVPTDQAATRTIELLGAQTIDPSNLNVDALLDGASLPASVDAVRPLVQQALDALPAIALPATLAELRVTPASTTRTSDSIVQRALGIDLRVAGRPVADLVLGEATIRAGAPAAASASAALQCTRRRLVLIDVLQRGRRVRILGAADRRYVGRTVAIVFTGTNRRVARARVRRDGTFSATAPLPRRTLRAGNRARYQARIGRERSMRLKLRRRMVVRSLRVRGRKVRISGRVTRPLARPVRAIEVRRRVSCRRWVVVGRIRPRRDGTFTATLDAPPGRLAATYRFATRVRKTSRNRKTYPTFTLPRHVDLG